ncbi:MAG: hypothetical protein AAFY60_00390, partial [Myxococcota bacterium]
NLQQTEIYLDGSAVVFRALFDVDVDVDLDLQLCALPDTSCAAYLDGESLELFARVRLDVAACEPDVYIEQLNVNLTPSNTNVSVGDCGLYDNVVNGIYGWLEGTLLDFVTSELETTAQTLAPELVSETFDAVASEGVEALGFKIFVAPESLNIGGGEIQLSLGAGVTPVVPPARCSPGGTALLPPSSTIPMPPLTGGASLAVSKHFANYLVDVAWRQGWLCVDTRDLGLDIGASLSELATGLEVNALVFAPVRPSLLLGDVENGGRVGIDIPSLEVQVGIEVPGAPPSLVTIEGDAFAEAVLSLDPVDSAVLLTPIALDTERLDVLTTSGPIILDPDGLRGTIDELVLPLFEEQLTDLALTGGVFSAAGIVAELVQISSTTESISLALDLYGAANFDVTAPETQLSDIAPKMVQPAMTLTMNSYDDAPPQQYVSHWVTIDGVRESERRTGRTLAFSDLPSGFHTIELAAMDLAGNVDPTPVVLSLMVDSEPPTLDILKAPRGLARDSVLEIEHEVRDNETAPGEIQMSYTIGEIARENVPDIPIARGTLTPGEAIVLEGLTEDRAYRVTLTATDRAGNVAEEVISFAVDQDPTLDCSATGAAPLWFALLAIAVLGWRRRLAIALALCVTCFVGSNAHAITTGGAFAGPTLKSGASSYWNAASLTQSRGGTRFFFEGGGSLINIDYARAGIDPGSGQNFENVNFNTISPALNFTLAIETPVSSLDVIVGGYSPTTSGAGWPTDGPQRFFGTDQALFTYAMPIGVLYAPSDRWGVSVMAGPTWGFVKTYTAFDFGNFANDLLPPGAEPFPTENELLEGVTYIDASGFGYALTAGFWAAPTSNLRFGVGAVYNGTMTMDGVLELQVPGSVEESTGLDLEPVGDIELSYRLPWALNGEVEYRFRNHRFAVTFDYQKKSRQDVTPALVTNSDPSFVDGPRLAIKAAIGDWTLGVRDLWRVNEDWDVALRLDYDPRSIPDESLNPVNLDFTSWEAAVGGRYALSPRVTLSMTYAFRYLQPIDVTNSLYQARLPGDSGLNLPSANGFYDPDPVHRIVLGVEWGG